MTDPRNIAHDKKVQQEKRHRREEIAPGADATPQPGKKTHMEHHTSDVAKLPDEAAEEGTGKAWLPAGKCPPRCDERALFSLPDRIRKSSDSAEQVAA